MPLTHLDGTDKLAPFGSGFVTGMAGNMIDRIVAPRHLAESLGVFHADEATESGEMLRSAWFLSLTRFEGSFQLTREASCPAAVRVQLELVQAGWGFQRRITRVWIPSAVLEQLVIIRGCCRLYARVTREGHSRRAIGR